MIDGDESALPKRPVQNAEAEYLVIPVGKARSDVVAVNTTEALRLSLPPPLQDSWKEIGLGPYALQADFLGFRQYLYGFVTGGAENDLGHYMMDVKARYEKWRDALKDNRLVLSICHNVCHDTCSLRTAAKEAGKNYYLTRYALFAGLKEYSRVNRMHVKYLR